MRLLYSIGKFLLGLAEPMLDLGLALRPPHSCPANTEELFQGIDPASVGIDVYVVRCFDFAGIWCRHMRGTFHSLYEFKALSGIEVLALNIIFGHGGLDFQSLATGPHLFPVGVGHAYCCGRVSIGGGVVNPVLSPIRPFGRGGHCAGNPTFDKVREWIGVYMAKFGALSVLVDCLAAPRDVGDVLGRFTAMLTFTIREPDFF